MKLKHRIRRLPEDINLLNEDLIQLSELMTLDNFAGNEINSGTTIINKNIVQGAVKTVVGSELDGAYINPASVTADKIDVANLTAISADIGEATSGSLVVGDTNKLWLNDLNDGGLQIGGAIKTEAPFRIDNLGNLIASSAVITGNITTADGSQLGGQYIVNSSVDYSALDIASFSELSAITANMGDITSGTITLDTAGHIKGGQTDFDTGTGFFLGESGGQKKLSIGDADSALTWNGDALNIRGRITTTTPINLKTYTTATLPSSAVDTTANSPSANSADGFGNGSDGALIVTAGQTLNLVANREYHFTSINIASGGTLSVSSTAGAVLYMNCQGSCVVDGNITLAGKLAVGNYNTPVTINGVTYNTPGVAAGGGGGTNYGFGAGGAGGGQYSDSLGGAGGPGGNPCGVGGGGAVTSGGQSYNGYPGSGYSSGGGGGSHADSGSYAYAGSGASTYGYGGSDGYCGYYAYAGGGGGAGGMAGRSGLNLVIRSKSVAISNTSTINTSGAAGQSGGHGGWAAIDRYWGNRGGNGGSGGGGGNAGNVVLNYSSSISNTGTIVKLGGAYGAGAIGGHGDVGPGSTAGGDGTYGSNGVVGSAGTTTSTASTAGSLTNPTNVYSSNDTYATCAPDSGKITVQISKDGGSNWSLTRENTFDGTEGYKTYGSNTDLWGLSLLGSDINSTTNFMARVMCGTSTIFIQDYSNFGFAETSTNSVIGIKVEIEAKYASSTTSIDHLRVTASMSDATTSIIEGSAAYDATLNMLTSHNGTGWESVALAGYPVGAIYISVTSTNPGTLFGGTWSAFATGRVLVGVDSGDADFTPVEHTAGGKTHSHSATSGGTSAAHDHNANGSGAAFLQINSGQGAGSWLGGGGGTYYSNVTASNNQDHTHTVSMGSGTANSTLQPSIAVYMFKRVS